MRIKHFFILLFISSLLFGFSACEEDEDDSPDEFPALDRGPVEEVDRLLIIFTETSSSSNPYTDTAEVIIPNGSSTQVQDSLELQWLDSFNRNISYSAQIQFFDGGQRVDTVVRDNAERFIVCYREFQTQELDLVRRDEDVNGFPLGLETDWITDGDPTKTNGVNSIRITLNYQAARKEGLCDAGIRIVDINLPYRLI